jgi:hypothetical protein
MTAQTRLRTQLYHVAGPSLHWIRPVQTLGRTPATTPLGSCYGHRSSALATTPPKGTTVRRLDGEQTSGRCRLLFTSPRSCSLWLELTTRRRNCGVGFGWATQDLVLFPLNVRLSIRSWWTVGVILDLTRPKWAQAFSGPSHHRFIFRAAGRGLDWLQLLGRAVLQLSFGISFSLGWTISYFWVELEIKFRPPDFRSTLRHKFHFGLDCISVLGPTFH